MSSIVQSREMRRPAAAEQSQRAEKDENVTPQMLVFACIWAAVIAYCVLQTVLS
jgi:hypothetical protein